LRGSLAASIRRRQREGLLPVLSEVKVRSPKEGDLLRGRDPAVLARTMSACPIAGLSVVTEPIDFAGDIGLIALVRPHVSVPILCKDFHKEASDLEAAAAAGADAALLTMCMLDDEQLTELHAAAGRIGLETLVEARSAEELQRLARLGIEPDILGINNRDIRVRESDDGDVSVTENLAVYAAPGVLLLSESSIRGPDDARRARDAGADAVLVGTSILLAADTAKAINDLVTVGWR
jgi:indole-3-glycerol phosphate synthase